MPYKIFKEKIPQRPGLPRPGALSLNGLLILVVDDDEYNRRLARIILEKYGCRILEAGNAEKAIEMTGSTGIDLVLMDIHLPGMNGPEAAGEIKRITSKSGTSLPVIAVSASISRGDLENFRLSGLDDFILKPYEEERLVEMIARYAGAASYEVTGGDESEIKYPGPGYDLGPLKQSSGGNEAFVKEMITLFLADTDSGLSMLKELLEIKDWPAASELAHKMISPCRHLKADRLAAFLKEIENLPLVPLSDDEALAKLNEARLEFERLSNDIRKNIDL
jgi:CheY-like chemotaxis protein/HPt (histidine-containing phosphotransfer) domain-containing protein